MNNETQKRLKGFAGFSAAIIGVLALQLDLDITSQALWVLLIGFVVYELCQTFTDKFGKK